MLQTYITEPPVRRQRIARVRSVIQGLAAASVALAMAGADAAIAQDGPRAATSAGQSDGGLARRVATLEEQLIDMQVVVGTLESLAKSGGGTAAPTFQAGSGAVAADTSRIESLETQVRALTAQVERLSDQVRSLGGTPNPGSVAAADAAPSPTFGGNPLPPSAGDSFGSTTVTPGNQDGIGGLIQGDQRYAPAAGSTPSGPPASANASDLPPIETANPKQLYETAYGYLLQRDYGAAQTAFDEFLAKYPTDSLAGNAQYWLGESHYVRGQYKAAASAFLKGYQTYSSSAKAADSLLKLGMSLDRLGQKDAACSSYSELNTRFPNAPQSVKSRAQSERQRVGCT